MAITMKLKVLAVSLLSMFVLVGTAQAINAQRALRQMRAYIDEDCNSPEARRTGFKCLGWDVYHCYELGHRKVRCEVYEEYAHNGHRRTCYFKTTALEDAAQRGGFTYRLSRTECFNESP